MLFKKWRLNFSLFFFFCRQLFGKVLEHVLHQPLDALLENMSEIKDALTAIAEDKGRIFFIFVSLNQAVLTSLYIIYTYLLPFAAVCFPPNIIFSSCR